MGRKYKKNELNMTRRDEARAVSFRQQLVWNKNRHDERNVHFFFVCVSHFRLAFRIECV